LPLSRTNLSLSESIREAAYVALEVTLVAKELDVSTIDLDTTLLALLDVLLTAKVGEAPVLADNDFLTARELVLAAAESLDGGSAVRISCSDGEDNLADVHTGNSTIGLAANELEKSEMLHSQEELTRKHHAYQSAVYRHQRNSTTC
jgi:hypothetical protein